MIPPARAVSNCGQLIMSATVSAISFCRRRFMTTELVANRNRNFIVLAMAMFSQ